LQRAKPPAEVRRPRLFRREWLAPLALAGLTVALFYPLTAYPFVNYDDPEYVTENPHVTSGLGWQNTQWALTTLEMGNWHPLNWLSLQADATLYGPNAFGFHLTNVLLHAASAAFLFLALQSLTGAFWRSLAVALLFAVHPLRVEAVAWVSERKGDLSVFFGMLALWAYAGYVRRPSWWLYAAVLAAYCASLSSKPALATLPFLLLVLDWWPLGRLQPAVFWRRAAEKVPLLVPAVGVSVAGYFAQSRIQAVLSLPLSERAANAVTRYVVYFRQTFWPAGLGIHYPLPSYPGGAEVRAFALPALGLLVLLGLTAGAFLLRRRMPYLLVGWLWFLGTLAPVVVVQISTFAHADRYTYFPQIGLLIAICWGAADLAGARGGQLALAAACVAALALAAATREQLTTWKDSVSLWENALRAGGECSKSWFNLGEAYAGAKRTPKAIAAYLKALELDPDDPLAHNNLANAYSEQNRLPEALREYRAALAGAPGLAKAHFNYGTARAMAGDVEGAADSFREALRLRPDYAAAHCGLGIALLAKGRTDDGLAELNEALRLDPRNGEAYLFLAKTLDERKDYARATRYAEQAVRYAPENPMAYYHLGLCYLHLGRPAEAVRYWQKGLELAPGERALQAALASVRGGRVGTAP
jgi:tetratricopeptide (TPR) repeat protein